MAVSGEEILFNFGVIRGRINLVYYLNKGMYRRNSRGRFSNKSNLKREVRTFRVTDEVWEKLEMMASS